MLKKDLLIKLNQKERINYSLRVDNVDLELEVKRLEKRFSSYVKESESAIKKCEASAVDSIKRYNDLSIKTTSDSVYKSEICQQNKEIIAENEAYSRENKDLKETRSDVFVSLYFYCKSHWPLLDLEDDPSGKEPDGFLFAKAVHDALIHGE